MHEAELREALAGNRTLVRVLDGAPDLGAPNWYLAAGAVVQTVWNVRTGRPPDAGIRDYDLVYFDVSDLGWEAEDRVIRRARERFGSLGVEVEVRNEARVHCWYEQRFGVPCPPCRSAEEAIATFPSTTSSVGVRVGPGGWEVFAPYGLADPWDLVVRPNPVLAPREVYEAKAARWKQHWPELTVLPWPEGADRRRPARDGGRLARAAMLLVVTDDGRLLLHLRDDIAGIAHPGCWAGFGGAAEEGESVEEALRREVLEETGLAIGGHRLLTEAVDVEGDGRLVSLSYVVGGIRPEDVDLREGAGVGVHSLSDLPGLRVTPFVRRAIVEHLAPMLGR